MIDEWLWGALVEWKLTGKNWSAQRGTLFNCQFACHKSHTDRNEIKTGRSRWKFDSLLPVDFGEVTLWQVFCKRTVTNLPIQLQLLHAYWLTNMLFKYFGDRRHDVLRLFTESSCLPVSCRIYFSGDFSVLRYVRFKCKLFDLEIERKGLFSVNMSVRISVYFSFIL